VRQHHDTPDFLVRGREGAVRGAAYLDAMHTSVFCVAAPGSGWGIRAYHALLHGCMPVFIPGDVDGPALDDVLPWSRFSLRVAIADIPNLPDILRALPEKRVRGEAGCLIIRRQCSLTQYRSNCTASRLNLAWESSPCLAWTTATVSKGRGWVGAGQL
jgi:hypothetical protein